MNTNETTSGRLEKASATRAVVTDLLYCSFHRLFSEIRVHSRPFVVPICMPARQYGDTPTRRFAAAARDPRVRLPHRRISPHSAGGSLLLLSENPGRGLPRK